MVHKCAVYVHVQRFCFPAACISMATHTGMIIVRKPNLESGTPGFESFIESAASDQPLDLHGPYLSLFPSLLFLVWRVSLLNSLNRLWNKRSSHCRGKSSSREICVCNFTHFNKCEMANKSNLLEDYSCSQYGLVTIDYKGQLDCYLTTSCVACSLASCTVKAALQLLTVYVAIPYISVLPPLSCFAWSYMIYIHLCFFVLICYPTYTVYTLYTYIAKCSILVLGIDTDFQFVVIPIQKMKFLLMLFWFNSK